MRHARLDELLGIRDGEPVDAVAREHAEQCASCGAELDRLRRIASELRDLPAIDPPEDRFAAISSRISRQSGRRLPLAFAVAATAIVATVVALVAGNDPRISVPEPDDVTLDALIAQSRAQSRLLERALEELPDEGNRMSARTAGTIAGIEDRIARVDYWLNRTAVEPAPDAVAGRLWQERVDLLNSLWHVRWNEEVGAGYAGGPAAYDVINVNEER